MSESKPEYITDAEEMIGKGYDQPTVVIEPPRTTTARHNGHMVEVEEPAWVKFSTDFKEEIGLFDVYALKVFIYVGLSINWQSGEAFPGVRKIAEDAKMDKGTVIQAVQWLESNNYMTVFRREGKPNTYKPLRYFSIGTVRPDRTPTEELSGENGELSGENEEVSGDPRVNLHNKNNKKNEIASTSIEAAMYADLPVTEEMAEAQRLRDVAPKMFEKALGFTKPLPWWSGKDWDAFSEWVVEQYKTNKIAFGEYNIWRNTPYTKGGMANTRIRGFPAEFYDSWDMFQMSRQPVEVSEPVRLL